MAEENSKLMNQHVTIFASGAKGSGANNSNPVTNHSGKGGIFWLEITAKSGTSPTLDVKLQGYDQDGGDWVDLGDNVAGTGAYAFSQKSSISEPVRDQLTVYPGLTASGNAVCSGILPNQFRAVATVGGSSTPTVTFTLGVDLIDSGGRMANELRHKDVGTALSKSEWEGVTGHILNSQAAGDIIYASSTTQLSRLGIGAANQLLAVNSAGTAPEWTSSPPVVTALVPDAADGATLGTASAEFSDLYLADGGVIYLGNDQDVSITHVADTGILLNSTMQIQFNDASQYINAPSGTVLDINATDEIELNATLVDANANLDVSGTYTGGGLMTTGGNIVIPNAGNIGSASDTDAIAISSGGVVTMNQIPVFSAGINVSGGTITGTIASGSAAQGNITSLGTLTALTVDNIAMDGTTIGHTSDTDLITLADGVVTVAGEVDATTLDISGNADIDGTLEADAYTVDGTALATYIRDTVGTNMLSSNTESGITVTYDTSNDNIDFAIDAAQTGITSLLATDIKIGEDDQTKIDFETADTINFYAGNENQLVLTDGALTPASNAIVDLGTDALEFKDGYFDGTLEADAITVAGTALNEYIADTVGAMVTSNTESGITVAYVDDDNTLDFTVGTLNQDTTGTADNITASANNTADETVYPTFVDGATGSQGIETDTGLTYNPNSGILTATQFTGAVVGNVTGNASGTAGIATTVAIADNESTNEDNVVVFGAGGVHYGASIGLESDGNLIYNPSTGILTSTRFSGAIDGILGANSAAAITGTTIDATTDFTIGDTVITDGVITDTSGLSIAAAVDLGANTLTSTGSMQIRTIDYSDGDLAMTIADGGGVTFAQNVNMDGNTVYGVSQLSGSSGDGPRIAGDEASTATNPGLIPDRGTMTTGIGGTGDYVSSIVAGTERIRATTSGATVTGTVDTTGQVTAVVAGHPFMGRTTSRWGGINLTDNEGTPNNMFQVYPDDADLGGTKMILSDAGTAKITLDTDPVALTFATAATVSTSTGALTIDGDDGIVLQTTGSGDVDIAEDIELTGGSGTTIRTDGTYIRRDHSSGIIAIDSQGDVRINIDTNANGTNDFTIGGNGSTDDIFKVVENGNTSIINTASGTWLDMGAALPGSGSTTYEGGMRIHASSGTDDRSWAMWADAHNPRALRIEYSGARGTGFGSGTPVIDIDYTNLVKFWGNIQIGSGSATDRKIVFDGNAQDFYLGLDDGGDALFIGSDSTVGSNGAIIIDKKGGVSSDVPHVGMNATPNINDLVTIGGAFAGYSNTFGLRVEPTLTAKAGNNASIISVAGTLVEASSGTHTNLFGTSFSAPSITNHVSAAVTNTATVYISGAPSATVTGGNYALWVDADASRFDGVCLHYDGVQLGYSGTGTGEDFLAYGDTSGYYMWWDASANSLLLGESANANMTSGITINQGAADDDIFSLKSSDVGHPFTHSIYANSDGADTFFSIKKIETTSGGALVRGFKDSAGAAGYALYLQGLLGEAADTTDTTSSAAVTMFNARVTDGGTEAAAVHDDGNAFGWSTMSTMLMLIKGDGDIHASNVSSGAGDMNAVALDNEDDIGLVRTFQRHTHNDIGTVMSKWDDAIKANEDDLRRVGVLTGDFYSIQRMNSLLGGAIWQGHTRQMELQEEVSELKTRLLALEGGK